MASSPPSRRGGSGGSSSSASASASASASPSASGSSSGSGGSDISSMKPHLGPFLLLSPPALEAEYRRAATASNLRGLDALNLAAVLVLGALIIKLAGLPLRPGVIAASAAVALAHAALLRHERLYAQHRTSIVAAARALRGALSTCVLTHDLSCSLEDPYKLRRGGGFREWAADSWRFKNLLVTSGALTMAMVTLHNRLPFGLAAALHLAHALAHAALWLPALAATLACSNVLVLMAAARDALVAALYMYDSVMAQLLVVDGGAGQEPEQQLQQQQRSCAVLPFAVGLFGALTAVAPLLVVYGAEARGKVAFLRAREAQAAAAAASSSSSSSAAAGAAAEGARRRNAAVISPVVVWVAATDVDAGWRRAAWLAALVALSGCVFHAATALALEVLAATRGGLLSPRWCPAPVVLARAPLVGDCREAWAHCAAATTAAAAAP